MTNIVGGGVDSGNLRRKEAAKQGLHQITSVNTQVAISRRVKQYRLALLSAPREAHAKIRPRLFLLIVGAQMGDAFP